MTAEELRDLFVAEVAVLIDRVETLGASAEQSVDEIAHFAATKSQVLSELVNDPGFEQAVDASVDSIALFAGLRIVDAEDEAARLARSVWSESIRFALTTFARILITV